MSFLLKRVAALRYRISTLHWHRFEAAENILRTIWQHDNQIQQDFDGKRPSEIIQLLYQNQNYSRTLLSDRIRENLTFMKQKQPLMSEVVDGLLDLFDPLKGVQLTKIPYYTKYQRRFLNGVNSSNLFPLNPNSSVMRFFLKNMFWKPYKQLLINNPQILVHIKGSSGLGKSSCLFTLKYIMDLRIKHLIESQASPNSIFNPDDNCKILYFHALNSKEQIALEILKNIEDDFGTECYLIKIINHQFQKTAQDQINIGRITSEMARLYSRKKIGIIVIVDQLNNLYNKLYKKQKKQKVLKLQDSYYSKVQTWQLMKEHCKGFYMISSKNNTYHQDFTDLLQYINGNRLDLKEQITISAEPNLSVEFLEQYVTLNMDNYISPQARLCYSLECLLFEFQKKGISRPKAIKLLQKLKDVPFISHLAIRNTIAKFVQLERLIDQKQEQSTFQKFEESINYNPEIWKLEANIKQLLKNQKLHMAQYSFKILMDISRFTSKQAVESDLSCNLKINISPQNEKVNLSKEIKVVSILSNQKQQFQLSDANFFFQGYVLPNAQKEQKFNWNKHTLILIGSRELRKFKKYFQRSEAFDMIADIKHKLRRDINTDTDYYSVEEIFQIMVTQLFERLRELKKKDQKIQLQVTIPPTVSQIKCNELSPITVPLSNNILQLLNQFEKAKKYIQQQQQKLKDGIGSYTQLQKRIKQISQIKLIEWPEIQKKFIDKEIPKTQTGKQKKNFSKKLLDRLKAMYQFKQKIHKIFICPQDQNKKNRSIILKLISQAEKFKQIFLPKIVEQMIKKHQKETCFYLRCSQDNNPAYDFLISVYKEGALRLFFIEATLQVDVTVKTKIQKLYKLLTNSICFQLLIEECSKRVEKIHIELHILQGDPMCYQPSVDQSKLPETFQSYVKQVESTLQKQIQSFKEYFKKDQVSIQATRSQFSSQFRLDLRKGIVSYTSSVINKMYQHLHLNTKK